MLIALKCLHCGQSPLGLEFNIVNFVNICLDHSSPINSCSPDLIIYGHLVDANRSKLCTVWTMPLGVEFNSVLKPAENS